MRILVSFGIFFFLIYLIAVLSKRRKILLDKKQNDLLYQRVIESFGKNKTECSDTEVDIFITAKDKYRQLIKDIENARHSVHLLYFIIRNDRIGRMIIDLLAKKAKQGVEIKVLYDYAGCLTTPCATFQPLIESGAQVASFFPLKFGNYLRFNFRNHRKLVLIDHTIAYLGGMNIGDEYMGLNFDGIPWRDTHLRLTGSCVIDIQMRFLNDWRFATDYRYDASLDDFAIDTSIVCGSGNIKADIVSSGPDTETEEIKWRFLKMIYAAKERIYIQTPYFVPDESFLEALKIAAFSGVRVVIMAPTESDNFIAQRVSMSYLGALIKYGVEVYLYKGFLHAKMILVDDKMVSIGSANMDMRSFYLNFEINAFLYGSEITKRCSDIFDHDLTLSEKMTTQMYNNRSLVNKIEERIFRLFAPLL